MKKILPLSLMAIFIMQSCDPPFVTKVEWVLKKPFIADVNLMVSKEFADRRVLNLAVSLVIKQKSMLLLMSVLLEKIVCMIN